MSIYSVRAICISFITIITLHQQYIPLHIALYNLKKVMAAKIFYTS